VIEDHAAGPGAATGAGFDALDQIQLPVATLQLPHAQCDETDEGDRKAAQQNQSSTFAMRFGWAHSLMSPRMFSECKKRDRLCRNHLVFAVIPAFAGMTRKIVLISQRYRSIFKKDP
jgi:hypothetical protein